MLLALDAGNTNITIGIFKDGVLADHRRLRTVREQTSDEWGILLMSLLRFASLDPQALHGIIISSVVPPSEQRAGRDVRTILRNPGDVRDGSHRYGSHDPL